MTDAQTVASRALALAADNIDPRAAAGDLHDRTAGDHALLEDALRAIQDQLEAEGSRPSLQRALHYLTAALAMSKPIEP